MKRAVFELFMKQILECVLDFCGNTLAVLHNRYFLHTSSFSNSAASVIKQVRVFWRNAHIPIRPIHHFIGVREVAVFKKELKIPLLHKKRGKKNYKTVSKIYLTLLTIKWNA